VDVNGIGQEDVNWMQVAQDINHCRAFVNTIMNLRFP